MPFSKLLLLFLSTFYISFNAAANQCNVILNSKKTTESTKEQTDAAHKAITEDLYNGRITEQNSFNANENNQKTFLIKLINDNTQQTRTAIGKPLEQGNPYARNTMEYVGYFVNRLLDMDYVFPTAYRKKNEKNHFEGSLGLFIPNMKILFDVDKIHWNVHSDIVLSDHRILNVMMQNPDAHYKNLGYGPHWVDGKPRPIFLDFGASFKGGDIRMDHFWAFKTSHVDYEVKIVSKRTYEALKAFSEEKIQHLVPHFLNEGEAQLMVKISKGIIQYFDNLSTVNGVEKTIINYDYP